MVFYNQKTCQPKGASTPTMITRMRTVRSLVLGIRTYKTSSLAILTLLIGYNMTTKAAVHTWRTTRASELKTSGNPKSTVNYVIFHRARDFQTITTEDIGESKEYSQLRDLPSGKIFPNNHTWRHRGIQKVQSTTWSSIGQEISKHSQLMTNTLQMNTNITLVSVCNIADN